MPELTRDFAAGNYRFIPAVFQYSSGAAAHSGFEIERVRFDRLIPLAEGFARAAKHIQAAGRPLTSFCACELRSPAAFTEAGFLAFNRHYVKTLAEWGIFDGTSNPVAAAMSAPRLIRRPSRHFMHSLLRALPTDNTPPRQLTSSLPAAPRLAAGREAIPSGSCAIAIAAQKV
jgi:hypothetical protein